MLFRWNWARKHLHVQGVLAARRASLATAEAVRHSNQAETDAEQTELHTAMHGQCWPVPYSSSLTPLQARWVLALRLVLMPAKLAQASASGTGISADPHDHPDSASGVPSEVDLEEHSPPNPADDLRHYASIDNASTSDDSITDDLI